MKHQLPERLLGRILNDQDCFHHFIASQENGTEQTNYICKYCFKHLDVYKIESQKGRNPIGSCSKHYYYTIDTPTCTKVYEAHCVQCQFGLRIHVTKPSSPLELLKTFMFNKDINTQINILLMFVFYLGNIVKGGKKPINSENQKFKSFIGIGQTSLALMDAFGYTLVDGYFVPKQQLHEQILEKMIEELSLKKDLLSNGTTSSSIFKFSEATFVLAKELGASVPFQQPPQEFLIAFAEMFRKSVGPFELMGILTSTPDSTIIDCFDFLRTYDLYSVPRLVDAITDIAQSKSSTVLEEFIMIKRSKGSVGYRELQEAYQTFGNGFSDDTHPSQIIEVYRYLCTANPQQMDSLMRALRIIASHRDCVMLSNFVSTGVFNCEGHDQVVLPAGLNNIGNTCYMNSLIQYYFSITSVREYVLASTKVEPDLPQDAKDYPALKKALDFVQLLKQLFMELIWSDALSVTPEQRLAEIILSDMTGAFQFGEQQDLHECMDNVVDMFENALKRCVDTSTVGCSCTMLHRMFFGKTKQVLDYVDEQGQKRVLENIEPFHQLILNVKPTLYESLDSYFNHHTVDFENTKANRKVDILSFPSILTIRLNRVNFDRSSMQTVKSNEFLHYPKILHLERYSASAESHILDKRQRMTEIQNELKEAKEQLEQLTTKNDYPDIPLNMLKQTVNIMHMHPQHVQDTSLLETMQQHITNVQQEIAQLEQKVGQLEQERTTLFRDVTNNEYHLFGVFLHEGEASFGHYWLYLYDSQNKRWLKYNDSLVSPVQEEEVFANTTGKTLNAQSLIYVASDKLESLTSVMMILSIGSINIDDVYTVPHIVQQGETLGSTELNVYPGGKGANQCVALAKAGAKPLHFGKIGKDGLWVLDVMKSVGVDTSRVIIDQTKNSGKAIIQVTGNDNAIILYPGTNHCISKGDIDTVLSGLGPDDWVLFQNELNSDATSYAINMAFQKGCTVCFNPAPCSPDLINLLPIDKVHILFLNEIESFQILQGMGLSTMTNPSDRLMEIMNRLLTLRICIITLGKDGCVAAFRENSRIHILCEKVTSTVNVVDTTGAGDTFIGFFLATIHGKSLDAKEISQALSIAVQASGICCETKGAMTSIPWLNQVLL